MIFEGLSEIAAAPQTAGMTDGCHGITCFCQHPAGHLQSAACHIFRRSRMQTALKNSVTFPFAEKCGIGEIPDGNLFRNMIAYVDHHCFYLVVRFPVRSRFALKSGGGDLQKFQPYLELILSSVFLSEVASLCRAGETCRSFSHICESASLSRTS